MSETYLNATFGQRREGRAGREMRNSEPPLRFTNTGVGPAVEFIVAFCWKIYRMYISRSTYISVGHIVERGEGEGGVEYIIQIKYTRIARI